MGERTSLLVEVSTNDLYIKYVYNVQCNASLQSLVHKGLSGEGEEVDGEGSLVVPMETVSKEMAPFRVAHHRCPGPQLVTQV